MESETGSWAIVGDRKVCVSGERIVARQRGTKSWRALRLCTVDMDGRETECLMPAEQKRQYALAYKDANGTWQMTDYGYGIFGHEDFGWIRRAVVGLGLFTWDQVENAGPRCPRCGRRHLEYEHPEPGGWFDERPFDGRFKLWAMKDDPYGRSS